MLYLENPPASAVLEEELPWEKTFAAESQNRHARNPLLYKLGRMPKAWVQAVFKRDKLLSLVNRYFAPGQILDLGCADGHTLAAFPPNHIPCGIEISKELSKVATACFAPRGGFVIQGDAPLAMSQLPPNSFTGIIMSSYLEHETRAHEVLVAARNVMKDTAKLVVKVPNYACWNRVLRGRQWCGFRFPDHVNYFTPKTLTILLWNAGFRIHHFGFADHLPTSDTMWVVAEPAETVPAIQEKAERRTLRLQAQ
jgi:SAM-dependent methyltransferase